MHTYAYSVINIAYAHSIIHVRIDGELLDGTMQYLRKVLLAYHTHLTYYTCNTHATLIFVTHVRCVCYLHKVRQDAGRLQRTPPREKPFGQVADNKHEA